MKSSAGFGIAGAITFAVAASARADLPLGVNIGVNVFGEGVIWNAVEHPDDFVTNPAPNGATFGGFSIADGWTASWEAVTFETDASIAAAWTLTNTSATAKSYIITFITPGSFAGPSVLSGSVSGILHDNNGDGASFSTFAGLPAYRGLIDAASAGPSLFNPPHLVQLAQPEPFVSLGAESFAGVPGGIVAHSIGIQHVFTLSAGDSVTFDATFQVAVPGPSALPMLASLAWMVRRRKRNV